MDDETKKKNLLLGVDISDQDIYEAMKDIKGYLDITPADLKQIYGFAYRHAIERITTSVKAGDVMTKRVFSVLRKTPLTEVAKVMAENAVSGVPVLEGDGRVAGVISEKDFLSRMGAGDRVHFMSVIAECLKGKGCLALPIRSKCAEDIMSSPAITVFEGTPAIEIADIFTRKNINRVLVVDSQGGLTGLVSRTDIVRASLMRGR